MSEQAAAENSAGMGNAESSATPSEVNPAKVNPANEKMAQRTTLWRIAIFGVLLAFIAFLAVGLRNQNRSAGRPTGIAPDFQVTTFDGEVMRLSELRGKGVVVNFWASWCVPCRTEAPILEDFWKREKDQGIIFVGLDYLDQDHKAKEFLNEFGITYPNGPDLQSDAARNYGITGVPETFFIGPDGTVKANKIGEIRTDAELNDFLNLIRPSSS